MHPCGGAGKHRSCSSLCLRNLEAGSNLVQVEDELSQVLNRIDVMVRWWRDERHAWLAAPQVCDVGTDLLARQLATLTCRRPTHSHAPTMQKQGPRVQWQSIHMPPCSPQMTAQM